MASWNVETQAAEAVQQLSSEITGKTFVITGPSKGGIGAAVAETLSSANPKHIILAGRNPAKIAPIVETINSKKTKVAVTTVSLDLLDNASVEKAAQEILSKASKIDVLINNAGIMAPKDFVKSKNGVESQLAANHIGHFLLTSLLLPALGQGSRIVNVASQGYQLGPVRFNDYNFEDGKAYNRWVAYGQSKTAGILFTAGLGEKLKSRGVAAFAPHPGVVLESQLAVNANIDEAGWVEAYTLATQANNGVAPPPDSKSISQAVACVLIPALDPALKGESGAFLVDNKPSQPRDHASGSANIDKLWTLSERLVGQQFAA